MYRNRALADFEVDSATGEARIIDTSADDGDLLALAGLAPQNGNRALVKLVARRAISPRRADKDDILEAFGAKSTVDLAFMGHGLSLSDQFWYRAPGSSECWEDVNFLDNGWDSGFGAAVLEGAYSRLASCSPDVPEATTSGHAIKAWERSGEGISLVKAAVYPDGSELAGAKLACDLCRTLFGEGRYVPMTIVKRHGRFCSVSPLMLAADEELADGNRLSAMAGMRECPGSDGGGITAKACNASIDAYTALGIVDASAHVAMMACFACLALLLDFNPGNFGAIRKVGAAAWRPAPIFDYDGSFGFPFKSISISQLCENPQFTQLFCAQRFAFLDPSWDWSWYDPHALDGFEGLIEEALAPYQSLPSNFAELIARLFTMQRMYVNEVASAM